MNTQHRYHASAVQVIATSLALVLASCTNVPETTDSTLGDATTITSSVTITTLLPPPEVDVGVDLESAVIRLAVVGDISDDLWAGHFAYWNSINVDLGGIGGRYTVELVQVDSIRDAFAAGSLAVSIDRGSDETPVLELLVATQSGADSAGRLADLLAGDIQEQVAAVLSDADLLQSEGADQLESVVVTHPDRDCGDVEAVSVASGALPEYSGPVRFVLCVPGLEILAIAAEVLGASPGSSLVVPGTEWTAGLAGLLAGTEVHVVGFLPGPGVDGAPASDVMGTVLGDGPWSGEELEGYRRAIAMHFVLERALATDTLTRLGVRGIAVTIDAASLGFGEDRMAIGLADIDSPTGIRHLGWFDPQP